MVPVFPDMPSSWSVSWWTFPLLLWLCLLWLYWWLWLIYSSSFLIFYFPFSQFPTIRFSIFFLKFVTYLEFMKCCSIFGVLSQKCWVYYQLNVFTFTHMIFYNHSFQVILVNDAKYIYLYPTFQLRPASSHLAFTLQL